jgi:hypothetical protein
MNADDCGVWALDKHDRRILRFSAEGALEREIRVRELDPRLDEAERLDIDPYDGSLWLTDERRAVHISFDGKLLGSFLAPGSIRRFRVALDQTLWILGRRDLWQLDGSGNLLASYAVGRHLAGDARFFAIDSLGGFIWLADHDELVQLKLANPGDPPLRIRLSPVIAGLALDPYAGNVWLAKKEALLAFGKEGALVHRVDLEGLGIRRPEKLAFDPVSRSLWVGAEKSVSRLTDTGQFVITFSARDGDEAIGVPALKVQPTLALIRPPENALTSNPQPELRLGYGADCNAVSCGFSGSYFSAYALSATLNDQPVGSAFHLDPAAGEASYLPPARLPEGANTFTAQAKDSFGHQSNAISNTFTVDTIAPRFLNLTPADGTTFQTPNVTVQGTTDDPQATVVLDNLGLSQTGTAFAFPVILLPGANAFTVSAIDRAGNAKSVTLRLVLSSVAITIDSPANGATINGDSVTVSGSFQGPANTGVTVNGIPAAVSGNTFTALNVPLQAGANNLTAVATTLDLQSATRTVTVSSTGPASIQVVASPAQDIAPLDVTFTVNNRTDKGLLVIKADFEGTGSFAYLSPSQPMSHRYTVPKTYQAQFIVTDATGKNYPQTVTIAVQDPARVDQTLRATWSGFASALVARDAAKARQYFNTQGQAKYGPVLDTLQPSLPQIAASFSDLQMMSLRGDVGEYVVNRVIDGVNRAFFIYFLRDTDGVWRLDSM